MTLSTRHLVLAALLHGVLLALLLLSGVQCTPHIETTPVIQGVLVNPSDLKQFKPPSPPTPTPPKPEEQNEGPQQIVKNTDVVADQAKEKHDKAEAEQKKADEQKAAEQQQKDAEAKAQELKQQQQAQKEVEQAELLKKQQDDAKRKADAAAAAAAEEKRQKDAEAQLRKEAEQEQQAQAAAMAKQKKAEEAQHEADRRKRAAELQASLGVESAQLTAQMQSEWAAQLVNAINQAWARPPGTDQNLKAYLLISLSSTGLVQSASIATSSGVPAYDESLKRAVYRASPLPLPQDPSAFVSNVNICFSPNPRNCQ